MKKSIFLFFAAILCAMTANAQWYLRGSFNDWGTSHKFVNNVCEIELPAGTSYEFKVADANWSTGYGYPEITSTSTKTQNGGGNTKFKTGLPGIYKFEISSDAKKLTVTYPEVPAPHDITVRAKVPAHWTNDIYAHVWTSENASGSDVGPLTKEGDYYVVTKNAGALYVIFKNGSAWSDKNQTVDLCYTEDVCLQLNQSGSAKATATVIDCGAVSKDITVKAVVPGAWEDKITAWVWPTGGEGKEVTPTKEGNWYVITENCIELNVIFKNGTGWNGNDNQTANITGVSENTCYQISALNKDGEGKCTYTVVDCEAAIEPEAKPVDVYTIVGAETLVGTAWDLNNTDNDMTKQGDGSYVLVKENVELATTGTYEYKVVKNRSWDWKGVNGGNNLTLTGVDVDGTYNVTFTLNKELNALTASLELVEAKKVIPECYVAGDESLTGQDWNAKSVSMTYDEATEVYTATLTAVPAGTHNMKVVYGGEWLGFDHLSTPAPANVKEGEDKKIQFTLAEAGDVTVTYHATNGIGLTGNFAVPAPKYYIAGTENLTGFDWKENGLEMTKEGDVYKHTFSELNADEYEFKITAGDWEHQWNYSNLGAAYEEVSEGVDDEGNPNGNIKIVTEEAKNITVIFDATAGKITLEGLTEKVVVISYVLMGVGNDWTTGIALTKNETAEYEEYVLLGQEIAEGDAVKVVTLTNGVATAWCGNVDEFSVAHTSDDNGNIVLAPGKYDFYFKVNDPATADDDIIYIGGEAYPTTATVTVADPIGSMSTYTGVEYDESAETWSKVYNIGEEVTISVNTVGEGWVFAYWTVGEEKIFTEEYTFTVAEDVTVTATYAMAMDVTFDNLVLDAETGIVTAGPDALYGIELTLGIDMVNDHPKGFGLVEGSSISLGGNELELVTGYFTAIDVNAPSAEAVVMAVYEEMLMAFVCSMTAAPAPAYNVVVENATLTDNLEESGSFFMDGTWSDGETIYPVKAEIPGFDATVASATYRVTVTVGGQGDEPWLGFGEGEATVTVNESVVTLTVSVQNEGFKADVTISGTLPKPQVPTALGNIDSSVAPVKMINNGQLVIINNGVQYNAQGAVVK